MAPKGKQAVGDDSVSNPKVSRHEERTALTRARLVEAAAKIFARDGFEAAKLEEIASDAGYTRGAFYANFMSKEELFLELIAQEVQRRMTKIRDVSELRKRDGLPAAERYKAFRQGYIRTMIDRTWNILFIEFKLFVLRHPELRTRVAERQGKAFAQMAGTFGEMFAGLGLELQVSPLAAGMALGALANVLGIDLIIGDAVTEADVHRILSVFFDALAGHCPAS